MITTPAQMFASHPLLAGTCIEICPETQETTRNLRILGSFIPHSLTVRIPVVSVSDTSKALLPCRVPDLQLHFRLIHHHHLVLQDTDTFKPNRNLCLSNNLLTGTGLLPRNVSQLFGLSLLLKFLLSTLGHLSGVKCSELTYCFPLYRVAQKSLDTGYLTCCL
jgi:hypothetical protein